MQESTPSERVHHWASPSTLQNLEVCPSYQGNETTHPRATAGTKIHKVIESRIDDNDLSDDDAEIAAECFDFYSQRKQLMEDARQRSIDEVAVSVDAVTQAIFGHSNNEQSEAEVAGKFPPIVELQETYLPIDDDDTTAGYFDNAIIDHTGTYAEAFDWKSGLWAVEKVSNNLQAFAYVLGLFRKFPKLEKIRFWFRQPAIGATSDAIFTRDQIPEMLLRIKVVVARAKEARTRGDFSTANPTIPGCLFCRHIGICPKVTEFACKTGSKFAPLQIPEHITPSMVQDEKNTGLGMQLAQVMAVWSNAFKQVTADRVLRGAPLPEGYALRSREGSRKVIDMKNFKVEVLKVLTEEEFESTLDVSIGAVEKAVSDKTPRGFKKEAIRELKTVLEEKNITECGAPACFLQAANKE